MWSKEDKGTVTSGNITYKGTLVRSESIFGDPQTKETKETKKDEKK